MRVFRAVGEMGEGEMGVRGAAAREGVLREREGRPDWAAVEMLRDSFGLAMDAREYMFICLVGGVIKRRIVLFVFDLCLLQKVRWTIYKMRQQFSSQREVLEVSFLGFVGLWSV